MLLADVEKKFVTLSATDLGAVSEELGLQPSEEVKALCWLMRRLILSHLESEEVTSLEDLGMSLLLATVDYINNLIEETDYAVGANVSPHEEETRGQPKTALEHSLSTGNGTTHQPTLSPQRPSILTGSERDSTQIKSQVSLHPMYRKDFRIIDQIVEVGRKDKLNFTSLERQIERGLQKGYDDGEIVEAVIQSIAPKVKLRSDLESR